MRREFWIRGIAAVHGAGRRLVCRPSRAQRGRARFFPLAHELLGRTIAQRAVRSRLVVIKAPALELLPDVAQVEEGFDVQAFIAKAPIKRFNIAIVDRLSRTDELQVYTVLVAPGVHRLACEFAPVVHRDRFRYSSLRDHLRKRERYPVAVECAVGDQRQAFAGELVDHRQYTKPAPVKELCAHEVHAPLLIGPRCPRRWYARSPRQLLAYFGPHREPILGIESIDPLGIYPPAFSAQDHRQPSITEAHPARRQLAQPHPQSVLSRPSAPIYEGLSSDLHQPRRTASAQCEHFLCPLPERAPLTGLYSFFCTISCRMWRSRDRSATSRLSLPFSSRS